MPAVLHARFFLAFAAILLLESPTARSVEPDKTAPSESLFRRDNLVAWCIVPFDAKKRGPTERVEMLERLGFKRYAYDWRAEHLPTFETELVELKKRNIELTALWFPTGFNKEAQFFLDTLAKHGLKTQLWVTGGGGPTKDADEQRQRVIAEANRIRPIAEAATKIGCEVALYNHGGWFGEPENQLAIIEELKLPNVGIVYNQHHGHEHLDRFPELLKKMLPHLLALNLNGMTADGDKQGKKILPLGQGDLDLQLLKTIRASGYHGPIGILGHTQDDAEERLRDNLDGLDWLLPQLDGKPAGPKPQPRTLQPGKPSAAVAPNTAGFLIAGRDEYRKPSITVECRATLQAKGRYNILVACDTKQSGAHWELFTMPTSGHLTAHLPGMQPDHVRSNKDICDNRPHDLTMIYEPARVRLYADGELVADTPVQSKGKPTVAGELAVGRLVEGTIGCDGAVEHLVIWSGARDSRLAGATWPMADANTLGLWQFKKAADIEIADQSPLKNPAKRVAVSAPATSSMPPPGVHLTPTDPRMKVVLIDRSPNDAYLGVKVDSEGNIFVGGREAVYVFEPKPDGTYGPRVEILSFPPDSIVMGLEFRGNDLYVLAANALYRVPNGRVQRSELRPERILWGLPLDLHVSFHCLAWGPEGDLYLNHGDPLLGYGDWSRPDHWGHWTLYAGPDGKPFPYTGQGAVLRVKPDGSNPRVVATGLRGPVGLAFDSQWNLFTNDNDHESRADQYAPARLLHVTPHIDFGWPRGWMASNSPDRYDLIEPMTPDLGRGVPCDLAWYEEPYFANLNQRLLMCRWDRHAVTSYTLKVRGASFSAEEATVLTGSDNARPVGIAVGRGGRLFVTSLYMAGNQASPYCASDLVMVTRADDPAEHPFKSFPLNQLTDDQLWMELAETSWTRRLPAHQEIIRRGGALLNSAANRLLSKPITSPALTFLTWLAAKTNDDRVFNNLVAIARGGPIDLQCQALRALGEMRNKRGLAQLLEEALSIRDRRLQLAALGVLLDIESQIPTPELIDRATQTEDTYLRQTATIWLAQRASVGVLEDLFTKSLDDRSRLGAVLAVGRRLTVPSAYDRPPPTVPLFYPKEGSFFKTKLRFVGISGEADLGTLGPVGAYTLAQRWATSGRTADETRLVNLLLIAINDSADAVRLQAAYWLSMLGDRHIDPEIQRTRQEIAVKRLQSAPLEVVENAWSVGPFVERSPDDKQQTHPPEEGAIDLTATYETADGPRQWNELVANAGDFSIPNAANGAFYAYFAIQSRSRQPALLVIDWESKRILWHNGAVIAGVPPRYHNPALSLLDQRQNVVNDSLIKVSGNDAHALIELQPGTNEILLRLSSRGTTSKLRIQVRAKDSITVSLPEKLDSNLLASRLRDAAASGTQPLAKEFVERDWSKEATSGDAAQGRKLFGSLGCVKCHAITADQKGGGGPSLAEAKRRFTVPHLVESVLLPSKQVAEPFRGTTIVMADGRTLSGLITSENAQEIELLLPDATRRVVRVSEIDQRERSPLSPMPQGLVKTPDELRHLLAYLLSERPLPP
jgi:putative heme-binding domain-containing protein